MLPRDITLRDSNLPMVTALDFEFFLHLNLVRHTTRNEMLTAYDRAESRSKTQDGSQGVREIYWSKIARPTVSAYDMTWLFSCCGFSGSIEEYEDPHMYHETYWLPTDIEKPA